MQLIYLIYDSIQNSVFGSQVWQPLVKRVSENPTLQVTLISFEPTTVTHSFAHPQIQIIQKRRSWFWGKINLQILAWQITSYLPQNQPYTLMARGPFAGYIAQQISTPLCSQLIIQARGLAHAEYQYSNACSRHREPAKLQAKPGVAIYYFKQILIWLRTKQLNSLECAAYQTKQSNIIVECVSAALQKYLVKNYHTDFSQTTIAEYDKPIKFTPAQCQDWRITLRNQLNIPANATVYCYSGSAHLWQCPDLVINFFKERLIQNQNSFLLILSNQPEVFANLLSQAQIPAHHYYATNVHHQEIYRYLAGADFGLIFREPHLLNWVSRPTKALEYASVGLTVLHNNTVNWLMETFPQN